MEFSPRGFQRNNAHPASPPPSMDNNPVMSGGGNNRLNGNDALKKVKASKVLSLLAVVVLVVAAVVLHGMFSKTEASLIDGSKHQAVFLSNGQVYFGKIDKLNNKYIQLSDIYYLNVQDQSVQPSSAQAQQNVKLVKLGCELHSPQDRMIIYKDQVTFWENLENEGKVVTAIKQYREKNPGKQDCNQAAAQPAPATEPETTTTPSNTTNSTNNRNTTTTPSTNNTTTGDDTTTGTGTGTNGGSTSNTTTTP